MSKDHLFQKSRSKSGGRKRGTPNKTTTELKEAILNAFDKVGGEDYMVDLAKSDPKVFCMLLARLLPSQIKAEVGVDVFQSRVEALKAGRARVLKYEKEERQRSKFTPLGVTDGDEA